MANSGNRLAMLAASLRRLFPVEGSQHFEQLLIDIDEAEWQHKLSTITLRCV